MSSADQHPGLNTIPVSDLGDPALGELLRPYRDQKDAWLRARHTLGTGLDAEHPDGLFMAEGELVVNTLIESEHDVVSVLCTPTRLGTMARAMTALPVGTPVMVAARALLEQIVGFDLHRGVLALGHRASPPAPAELLTRCRLLVVCEDLANHDNVGAVFRNVACLAGTSAGVLLSPGCCDPLYRKSLRVSMGHALRVPFARLDAWPNGLDQLTDAGFEILAMTPESSAEDIHLISQIPNTRPAFLLGAEGPGLTTAALERAARRVRIPMARGADSLNVATSLAVALSHIR